MLTVHQARMSGLRVVFLNRFIQELSLFFTAGMFYRQELLVFTVRAGPLARLQQQPPRSAPSSRSHSRRNSSTPATPQLEHKATHLSVTSKTAATEPTTPSKPLTPAKSSFSAEKDHIHVDVALTAVELLVPKHSASPEHLKAELQVLLDGLKGCMLC